MVGRGWRCQYFSEEVDHIKEVIKLVRKESGNRIFKQCKTQGCVFYIAEDVFNWMENSRRITSRLDIPVKGVKDFRFTPPFRMSTYRKVTDEMANVNAANKMISM